MSGALNRPRQRVLVRWNDDLDKSLLLFITHTCTEMGIKIPYEEIAKRMGSSFTEGAIQQHIAKLRNRMADLAVAPVPAPPKKGQSTSKPSALYSQKARGGPAPPAPPPASGVQAKRSTTSGRGLGQGVRKSTGRQKKSACKIKRSDSDCEDDDLLRSPDAEYITSGRKKSMISGLANGNRRLATPSIVGFQDFGLQGCGDTDANFDKWQSGQTSEFGHTLSKPVDVMQNERSSAEALQVGESMVTGRLPTRFHEFYQDNDLNQYSPQYDNDNSYDHTSPQVGNQVSNAQVLHRTPANVSKPYVPLNMNDKWSSTVNYSPHFRTNVFTTSDLGCDQTQSQMSQGYMGSPARAGVQAHQNPFHIESDLRKNNRNLSLDSTDSTYTVEFNTATAANSYNESFSVEGGTLPQTPSATMGNGELEFNSLLNAGAFSNSFVAGAGPSFDYNFDSQNTSYSTIFEGAADDVDFDELNISYNF